MPPELVAYLDYREINRGVASSVAEFRGELKKYPRNPVVRLCAVMNAVVASWTGDFSFDVQARFVRTFFPANLADRIIATKRPVFHRHQLLFVAREALEHCATADGVIAGAYVGGLGKVLLMANDHLHVAMPNGDVRSATLRSMAVEVMASTLPMLEANHLTNYLDRIARSFLMLSRFTEPLRGSGLFFDVGALFEQATGVPLRVYQALVWGSLSRFSKVDKLRDAQQLMDFALPSSWFSSARVPMIQIESFLADIGAAGDELAARLMKRPPGKLDLTIFRDKPLISEREYSLPVDFAFVADKLESGVFWRVHNRLVDNRSRDNFHSFWGTVFEGYLAWVFESHCEGKQNRFYRDPRFASDPSEQVCDGMIVCGRAAVLMEFKGSTFTAAGKYGGNTDVLRDEIEVKLVGEQNRRKGVRQLVNSVQKLCRESPDAVCGVDLSMVEVVIPVLITRDDIGSAWGLNAYLNERFESLRGTERFWRPVTALFCLSADDIEKLVPYLPDTSFSDLLMARRRADKWLMSSFWTAGNSVIRKKGFRKPQFVFDALRQLTDLTAEVLGLARPAPAPVGGASGPGA